MRELQSRAALIPKGKSIFRAPLKSTMTETKAILILSKATLRTRGLSALRAKTNAAQDQKVLRSEILAASITENRQSRNMGVFQKCPLYPFLSSVELAQYTSSTHHTKCTKIEGLI